MYIIQLTEYKAFTPNSLPPNSSIKYDDHLQLFLSEADRALARLDRVALILLNSDLLTLINSDPSRQLAKPLIGFCNENILAVI